MSTLNELIARYGRNKAEMDSYKKQVEADNKEIKDIMSTTGVTECISEGFKAKYSVSVSEDFDETKLISKLKSLAVNDEQFASDIPGLIEYKPVVNMNKLEHLIYNGTISPAALADCKTKKETARLTISKVKE